MKISYDKYFTLEVCPNFNIFEISQSLVEKIYEKIINIINLCNYLWNKKMTFKKIVVSGQALYSTIFYTKKII
jgi:hypothetical protein